MCLAKGYKSSEGAKVKIDNELDTIGTPSLYHFYDFNPIIPPFPWTNRAIEETIDKHKDHGINKNPKSRAKPIFPRGWA